jgi:predicted XRE-type DNA-binding protein
VIALKIKAEILSAIPEHVRDKVYTQAQLVDILEKYQPSVNSLLNGRISQVSVEKLLRYTDRLHLQTSTAVRPIDGAEPPRESSGTADTRRPARKLAGQASSLRTFQARSLWLKTLKNTLGTFAGNTSQKCG